MSGRSLEAALRNLVGMVWGFGEVRAALVLGNRRTQGRCEPLKVRGMRRSVLDVRIG